MLHAQRVNRLVLELPGNDRLPIAVAGDDPGNEVRGARDQLGIVGRLDQCALAQRFHEAVGRNEQLGIAERLYRSDGEDDLFACPLRGIELLVQLAGIERAGGRLDVIPIRPKPDDVEWIRKQRLEGRRSIQAERFSLSRPEADPEDGRLAPRDRQLAPQVGHRLLWPLQAQLEHQDGSAKYSKGQARMATHAGTIRPRPLRMLPSWLA